MDAGRAVKPAQASRQRLGAHVARRFAKGAAHLLGELGDVGDADFGGDLPIASRREDAALRRDHPGLPHIPLVQGIAETVAVFADLHQRGLLGGGEGLNDFDLAYPFASIARVLAGGTEGVIAGCTVLLGEMVGAPRR